MPVTKVLTPASAKRICAASTSIASAADTSSGSARCASSNLRTFSIWRERSGLRGRGGAGFPTGKKWSFLPARQAAALSRLQLRRGRARHVQRSHAARRGAASGARRHPARLVRHRLPSRVHLHPRRVQTRLRDLLRRARPRRAPPAIVGKNLFGTGFDLEVTVHRGAGAYICGEETGLLELARGQARRAAAQAAVSGDRRSVRHADGREQRRNAGVSRADSRKRRGVVRRRSEPSGAKDTRSFRSRATCNARATTKCRSVRRCAKSSSIAGGLRPGRNFMAVQPGGGSSACIFEEHLDLPYDYENMTKAGSMLGSGAFVVFDDTTDFVNAALQPGAILRARVVRPVHARAARAAAGWSACSNGSSTVAAFQATTTCCCASRARLPA